jgi:hypothetical protein
VSRKRTINCCPTSDDTQPSVLEDEETASGSAPDVESDDDVDKMGEAVGIHYEPDEELDISERLSRN